MLGTWVFCGVTVKSTSTRLPALMVKGTAVAEQDWLAPVIEQVTGVLDTSVLTELRLVGSNVTKVPARSVKVSVVPLTVCGVLIETANLVTMQVFGIRVTLGSPDEKEPEKPPISLKLELMFNSETFSCNPPEVRSWLLAKVTGAGVPGAPGGPGGPGGPGLPLGPVAKFTMDTVWNGTVPLTD